MTGANNKFAHGFTLIELIIVLSIVSLLLSVVAPISVKAVDKSAARTELLETRNWIKSIAFQSFIESRAYRLELKDDTLSLYSLDEQEIIKTKKLESLRFEAQWVNFNKNGLTSPNEIQGYVRGEPLMISLQPTPR
ncbi:MAG: hypothetical protein CMK63_10305 [Pseudoalteromonadaceae bacterium]|jgi:prepilin-type N-terminal cleavage/methylation domain-containing protein|uniref:prepilin-type N-terminal cleavage/methylation domain-containing protein n=1 Tax=Pseudoalteromonas TaxID=53246 RepID=UPI000C4DB44D|nr:prepilin-type N-terminal cleavage/methylation domain-containing protein [Pseudoalteromonas sp. bablab_jr004]MBD58452.1 hypothetical protein [Pseudoalteromonas sp.]MBU77374.1 hypothetical protein [Pseudoalteromonadaceae bacterium]HCV02406.1 hypothetical protein [Pseudoalteromonas sp.]|tara:strand:+ start:1941 stop:2348 length:408 start_codon:yes stop_codon:yes gene_type:complete